MHLAVLALAVSILCVWSSSEAKVINVDRAFELVPNRSQIYVEPKGYDIHIQPKDGDPDAYTERKEEATECTSYNVAPGDVFIIKSEGFPKEKYPNKEKCIRNFIANPEAVFTVECPVFKLKKSPECELDFLRIKFKDGEKNRFCGKTFITQTGTTDELTIKFQTDKKKRDIGFKCKVTVTSIPTTTPTIPTTPPPTTTVPPTTTPPPPPTTTPPPPPPTNPPCTNPPTSSTLPAGTTAAPCTVPPTVPPTTPAPTTPAPTTPAPTTIPPTTTSPTGHCVSIWALFFLFFSFYLTFVLNDDINVVCVCFTECGKVNRATRIVGGVKTEVHEYPWHVGLVSAPGTAPFCGASIINSKWIMTAAHCVEDLGPGDFLALIGDHKWHVLSETPVTDFLDIEEVIVHNKYDSGTFNNDIALLKVVNPIVFPSNNLIAPVCLPTDSAENYKNIEATVTGWGTLTEGGLQPNQLREVTVMTMTNGKCKDKYGTSAITSNMICAGVSEGGKDSCQGDSGGPLVTAGDVSEAFMVQIGVVSWGTGCARPNYPGVYTRVTRYLDWIAEITVGSIFCPPSM
ncbi:uncharacterized protein [Panulirus ornatus]|uniref:uncharacterized protein n=1 Tax=Panulirus ornatus TaxID=150431 RepID=UPI003A854778